MMGETMKSMSNVDIHTIVKQLNTELVNAKLEKAYQPSNDTILIKFRKPGQGRKDLVIQAGVRMHLTQYPLPNPTIPPHFPMLLRKHLSGATVESIRQYKFDRIIEINIQHKTKYKLIVELFSKGNVILLDEDNNIISPLKHKQWQDRKITSHQQYKYPPEQELEINNSHPEAIMKVLGQSDTDVTRTIAMNGLGGLYAEEILGYTDIDKKKMAKDITDDEAVQIDSAIKKLFDKIENHMESQIIIEKRDGKDTNKDVVPITLDKYSQYESRKYDDFNQACDEFYSKKIINNIKDREEQQWAKKIGKYTKRLKMQEDSLEGFYNTIDETQHKGDTIYAHYNEVQDIINIIQEARGKYSWKEISSIIKKSKKEESNPQLDMIESIDKMGVMTLKLDDTLVQVDTNKGIPESCEKYYNKGKKAKKKINGVKIAIENTKGEIQKLEDKREVAIQELETPDKKVKKQLKWYEKLRWFVSSDGYLVIGGRDANSNEQVVKKYSKSNDLYLHCDIHGAPSTIIQNNGDGEIPESTMYEAACFASSYSSAWKEGFSSYDSYWVNLDQVSKTPESGEFLKKGSFVIRGRKNFIRNVPVLIAIGVVDYDGAKRVMAGPVPALDNMCDDYVILKPGFTKKERISKKVLSIIDKDNILGVDDIVRNLPSGKCDVLDIREYRQKYLRKF